MLEPREWQESFENNHRKSKKWHVGASALAPAVRLAPQHGEPVRLLTPAKDGLSPLEVMLRAMREHALADRWDQAAAVAKDAAPYCHPRFAAVEVGGPNGGPVKGETIVYTGALADIAKDI